MEFNLPSTDPQEQPVRRHSDIDNGAKVALYKTGYEDERFEHTVSQSFHCIICTGVIKDPVMCPQNEHLFCRACITRHLKYSQSCPTCVEPLTLDTLSQAPRSVRNLLAELRIRCEFFDRGCGKFVDLGDLDNHVADCGFGPAVCSNEGCELEVNKQDLLHHETAVCDLRRIQCHSCNDIRREVDTVKVNLALMNEKLDSNEKRLSETLEKIEKNGKAVQNVLEEVERFRQQSKKKEGDIREIKNSLNGIKKLLETSTQQISNKDTVEAFDDITEASKDLPADDEVKCTPGWLCNEVPEVEIAHEQNYPRAEDDGNIKEFVDSRDAQATLPTLLEVTSQETSNQSRSRKDSPISDGYYYRAPGKEGKKSGRTSRLNKW